MPSLFQTLDTTTAPFDYIPISTADDVDFTDPAGQTGGICPRGLYVGGAGNLKATFAGATGGLGVTPPVTAVRTLAVAAGQIIWGQFVALDSTGDGTTATSIFAII